MKAIDVKTRRLIVSKWQEGESYATIAGWYGVSQRSVSRFCGQFVHTGSLDPKPHCGAKSKICASADADIRTTIAATPGITTGELIEQLALPVAESTLSRYLGKIGYTYKKNAFSKGTTASRCATEAAWVVG